jgi:hypothetical protein
LGHEVCFAALRMAPALQYGCNSRAGSRANPEVWLIVSSQVHEAQFPTRRGVGIDVCCRGLAGLVYTRRSRQHRQNLVGPYLKA